MSLYNNVWLLNSIKLVSQKTGNTDFLSIPGLLMEMRGIEPLTSCMRSKRSTK